PQAVFRGSGSFPDLVAVPPGDDHHDVRRAVGDALATEPGFGGHGRGLVEHVLLVLGRRGATLQPEGDVDVAGGAGADAAAGVVDLDPGLLGDSQQAAVQT